MNFSEKQFKKALKTIRMSPEERTSIRYALENYISTYARPIQSPFMKNIHKFVFQPMQVVAITLIVLTSSGTGLSYAASEALPGDPLYGFKINITEEIRTITMDSSARANYEVNRAAERLKEAAQLAITGKLDEEKSLAIREQLTKHTKKATVLAKKASIAKPGTSLNVATEIASELSAHSKVLNDIKDNKDGDDTNNLSAILATTQETVALAESDEGTAIIELINTNPELAQEQLTHQKNKLQEKLVVLESFVNFSPETTKVELEDISTKLETIIIPDDSSATVLKEDINEGTKDKTIPKVKDEQVKDSIKSDVITASKIDVTTNTVTEAEINEPVKINNSVEVSNLPDLIKRAKIEIEIIHEVLEKKDFLNDSTNYADTYTNIQKILKRTNDLISEINQSNSKALQYKKEIKTDVKSTKEIVSDTSLKNTEENTLPIEKISTERKELANEEASEEVTRKEVSPNQEKVSLAD